MEERPVLVVTVDTLPWPYQPIGCVTAELQTGLLSLPSLDEAVGRLREEAARVGADGVIGIRISYGEAEGILRIAAIGTAVRWQGLVTQA